MSSRHCGRFDRLTGRAAIMTKPSLLVHVCYTMHLPLIINTRCDRIFRYFLQAAQPRYILDGFANGGLKPVPQYHHLDKTATLDLIHPCFNPPYTNKSITGTNLQDNMHYSSIIPVLAAISASVYACEPCEPPERDVVLTRNVRRMQPEASHAISQPRSPLAWGQLNFMHTSDTHGWLVCTPRLFSLSPKILT